jgi:hypothetical protein
MEEFLVFRQLGYSRYKIIDQSLINLQTCPRPAREGNYCHHIFQYGSSGLFGEELPGTWLACLRPLKHTAIFFEVTRLVAIVECLLLANLVFFVSSAKFKPKQPASERWMAT